MFRWELVPGFLLASACTQQAPADKTPVDSLFDVAELVYYDGQHDSAAVLLNTLLTDAQQHNDPSSEARAITWLGLVQWRLGDYAAARELGERGLMLKLEHALTDQLLRSYNALGLLAWNESRLGEASELFEAAIQAAQAAGDRRGAAVATGNLALVQTEFGEFEPARAGFLAMQQSMAELGDPRAEGNALTNLGMIELRLGNPSAAVPYLTRAYELNQSIPYPLGIQAALGQLGAAYTELGEPEQAFATLDRALTAAREQGLRREESAMLETLAELYRESGDFRRASLLYDQATTINTQIGLDYETAVDYRGMADIQRELGNRGLAIELATRALEIHREQEIWPDVFSDFLLLAQLDSVRSWDFLSEARRLRDQLDTRAARVDYALVATDLTIEARRFELAEQLVHEIEPDLEYSGLLSRWKAQLQHSRVHSEIGPVDEGIELAEQALETMQQTTTQSRAHAALHRETTSHLIGLLLGEGRLTAAFEVSDQAPGRTTLRAVLPDSTAQRTRTRLREIDQLVESIDLAESYGESPVVLRARLDTLRAEYEELLLRLSVSGKTPVSVNLGQLQQDLGPGELLLEYLVGDDSLLTFAVTRSQFEVFVTAVSRSNLANRVRLARSRLADPSTTIPRTQTVLSGLFDLLLGPVSEAGLLSPSTELIIVPNEVLNYLPFAALYSSTTRQYLVETHTVRFLPSVEILQAVSDGESTSFNSVEAFAPFPDELPASTQEIQSINAVRFSGRRATEWRVRQALSRSDVVHVATHGVMNFYNPLFSRIELAPGTGVPADNGRLEVHELLNMTMQTALVFLSGCETGMSRAYTTQFARGEDNATLAHAFLNAGARYVVATLWPVEDIGAALLAQRFYSVLGTNSPAEALAIAQRELLGDDTYRHPYFWSPYQLTGTD